MKNRSNIIKRNAYKWLYALGLFSLVAELLAVVTIVVIDGGGSLKGVDWVITWYSISLIIMLAAGITAVLPNWKQIKKFVKKELFEKD